MDSTVNVATLRRRLTTPSKLLLLVLFLACAASTVKASVKATLVFDKPQYYLGENILVRYVMTNEGQDQFLFGNDAVTGRVRAERWKVTATDDQGKTVEDPYAAKYFDFRIGMAMGPRVLDAGKSYQTTLPLLRYCDFTHPGVYTVRIYHTAEWGTGEPRKVDPDVNATPVAEGTIRLVMPTPNEAANIVRQMQALPSHATYDAQGSTPPYADYTTLHYPVYLPILQPAAEQGDLHALLAIAAMPTPEATQALITLTGNRARPVACTARGFLLERLPVQGEQERVIHVVGSDFPVYSESVSALLRNVLSREQADIVLAQFNMLSPIIGLPWRELSQRSWRETMRPEVTALAWRLLKSADRDNRIWGAKLLRHVGGAHDLPRIIAMMDRQLEAMDNEVGHQRLTSPETPLCRELHLTANTLMQCGASLAQPPRTLAGQLVTLDNISKDAAFRPDGWQAMATRLLQHPLLYVRLSAAYAVPLPLDPALKTPVLQLAQEHDPQVQAAICRIATGSPDPRFNPLLLEMLDTADDKWLLISAQEAALACGTPADQVLDHFANRIGDSKISRDLIELLCTSTIKSQGLGYSGGGTEDSPEELAQFKARWLTFIADNRDALRAGTRFPIGQSPVTSDLLPRWLSLTRDDGTAWPARAGL